MPTSSRKKVAASTSTPTKQTRSSRRSSTRGKVKDKEEEALDDTNQNKDAPIPSSKDVNDIGSNNEKAETAEPQVKKTEQKEEDDSKPAAIDQSQANMNNNNMMMQHQTSNNQYLPSNAYMGSYMGMMNNFSPMAMSNYDPAMQAAMMQMMMQNNGGGGGSFNYPQAVVQTSAAEAKNFPETLFDVISEEDTNHIVSWLAHGKGFMITDKQAFAKVLLPKYFDGCKFTSFTRRLKRWNFERVARGPEIGAYYNPLFQRDNPEWVLKMRYRMDDSQFANAKAQSQDKMPDLVVNNNIPIPEDQMHEYQQNYVLSSKISSQTREFFAKGPADVLPLPSSLPKRPKKKKTPSTPPLDNPEEMRMMELQQQMIMSRSMQSQSVAAGGMPSLPGIPQAYDPANNPPETQQQGGLKTVLMTNEEQKSYLEYKAMKQNGEV